MIDVIIPTMKQIDELIALIDEVHATAGCPVNVIATCKKQSASCNRNIFVFFAGVDTCRNN